ncbi:hypothetical protein BU16DRAFT_16376 [Lophium mytilinum]|uniref:Uncharacterized protein n=1 Tax=Lophium mytilinum TaxID=390894 RepID=A0A6A6RCP6_9PEZI|nr:hypothetical protein BU16DRAFT_16376 [Lophium mytilinum]
MQLQSIHTRKLERKEYVSRSTKIPRSLVISVLLKSVLLCHKFLLCIVDFVVSREATRTGMYRPIRQAHNFYFDILIGEAMTGTRYMLRTAGPSLVLHIFGPPNMKSFLQEREMVVLTSSATPSGPKACVMTRWREYYLSTFNQYLRHIRSPLPLSTLPPTKIASYRLLVLRAMNLIAHLF